MFNYLIIIPVQNEEKVIINTIDNLLKINYDYNLYKIIFLLDNCSDNSLNIIKKYNLDYIEKKDNQIKGKSFALKWFIQNYKKIENYSKIIILDADSLIDRNFLYKISKNKDENIIQGFINPIFDKDFISSSLSGYSELISQKTKDFIKSKFNWSIVLKGTGMVLDKEIFKKYIPLLKTQIEDIELSILLVRDGYKIIFNNEAIVSDPKPLNIKQASNQRARWLYGQYQIIKYYWKDLIKIAFSGIGNFFFVLDIIFRPKTLFYLIKLFLLLFFIFTHFPFKTFLITILSLIILIDFLYFIFGGILVNDKKHYYKILLYSPVYIIIWGLSIIKMFLVRGKKWLKAR